MAKPIHSMIRVLDEARSVAFYRDAMGLEVVDRFPSDAFTLIYMRDPASTFELELTVNHGRTEPYNLGDGYGHLAVAVNNLRAHAVQQGSAVYSAVGATRLIPTPPHPSTHNMGTNRMSAKARDGVVNKFGQTHDTKNLFVSDGGQFTSGAACNPTLTIVALAIRQADSIARTMEQRKV